MSLDLSVKADLGWLDDLLCNEGLGKCRDLRGFGASVVSSGGDGDGEVMVP